MRKQFATDTKEFNALLEIYNQKLDAVENLKKSETYNKESACKAFNELKTSSDKLEIVINRVEAMYNSGKMTGIADAEQLASAKALLKWKTESFLVNKKDILQGIQTLGCK